MAVNNTSLIKRRYDRVAKFYDILDVPMELLAFRKYREKVLQNLNGKALEVGIGTGRNIEFYPDHVDITAIDFSPRMLEKARERASKYNKQVKLFEMDVQDLDFEDNVFDSAFSTCVFCSVPDPVKGLEEVSRVLKPGGKLILLEHVLSNYKLIRPLMNIINPLTVRLWGANINRETIFNIKKAGFAIKE